jgi:catechol 2,3-dioxygenase-like lactoylglutathione lyase family enzyme
MLAEAKLQSIVCTTRIEESARFYEEVLGLRRKAGSEGAVVFDVGGQDLRLSPVPAHTPGEHTLLGFAVDDIHGVIAGLRARGVAFERFPNFPHDADGVLSAPGGARVAWLRDPDRNLLSIVQYGSAA